MKKTHINHFFYAIIALHMTNAVSAPHETEPNVALTTATEILPLSTGPTGSSSESTAELYARDFDPLVDLPLPPAWHETQGFKDMEAVLSQQLATEEQVQVRVDLRLPQVETRRLDESQSTDWASIQEARVAELLASLPTSTYDRVNSSTPTSSLLLEIEDASLEVLKSSPLVANVSLASISPGFTSTRIDPPDPDENLQFGSRVRLSGDVALVEENNIYSYVNNAYYLFRRISGEWYEDKQESVDGYFSTALEDDLVAVGLPDAEPTGLTDEGDIRVYHWNGSTWITDSISLPAEHRQAGARLGYSVAISGNTLAVGAPGWDLLNDGNGNQYNDVGRVYVWKRQTDGQWLFQAVINNVRTPSSLRADDKYGYMVRLAGDTLLANLMQDSYTGIIDIWDRTNTSWNQAQTIPWSSNYSGLSDIAFNGTFAVLGKGGSNEVQVWRRAGGKGTSFNLATTLTAADGSSDNRFGYSLAV